jgi:predicted MPP superfamily phosphohydrolase
MRLMLEAALSLHFFLRCRAAFGGGWWQVPAVAGLVILAAPQISRARPWPDAAWGEFLAAAAPLWSGVLVLFLVAAVGLDLVRLLTGLAGWLGGRSWWGLLAAKRAVPLALILTLALAVHAHYMAYHPRLARVEVAAAKLPEGVESLRVVQLSDVHLSGLIDLDDLRRLTDLVTEARPDILVVTGDLVDMDMSRRQGEAELLAAFKPRYGAFAVMGNHELYAGEANAEAFIRAAGLRLLRGEAETAGGIVVAGIDDENFGGRSDRLPAGQLLGQFQDDGRFVLFLKHRPTLAPGTAGLFDLQLSGHTHGGQIWPGHFVVKRVNGVLSGLHEAPGGRGAVYTSRGAGFWGIPLRFLAPPEVTLIELVRVPPAAS